MPPKSVTEPVKEETAAGPSAATTTATTKASKEFPPPKTDKPRPHVCATCQRSFARLEHLKRHERSHTKEKPFECPECARCFARRDLLLRHQQKLHMTTTPSSRPRTGGNSRRESTSSVGGSGGRARKNSVSAAPAGRPRANTISHIDTSTVPTNSTSTSKAPAAVDNLVQQKMASSTLPRINTRAGRSLTVGGPIVASANMFPAELDFEGMFGTSTINPAALHYGMSPQQFAFDSMTSPFNDVFPVLDSAIGTDDGNYDWMNMLGNEHFGHEHALESSSPSAISTASAGGPGDNFQDGPAWWNNISQLSSATTMSASPYTSTTDFANFNASPPPPGTISPKALQNQGNYQPEHFYPPLSMANYQPDTMAFDLTSPYGPMQQQFVPGPLSFPQPTISTAAQSITESTRTTLLSLLSSPSNASQRRYSQAQSPQLNAAKPANIPTTAELQLYVDGYIKFFHPHMPFLHIPTLNFDSSLYASNFINTEDQFHSNGFTGGAGCLILSIAAIGALFEANYEVAKEIFELAKKMIQINLDHRRKASVSAAVNGSTVDNGTPVWLVQAMLLNVVFGLNSGENIVSDLALTHCAAVVSLARAAGLCKPSASASIERKDVEMGDTDMSGLHGLSLNDAWGVPMKMELDDTNEWLKWVAEEERKRTLYAVHKLSSMLCIAYNHAPALTNSEIRLDLPCDEDLWAAENANVWNLTGGAESAQRTAIPFSIALNTLLSAGGPQEARRRRASNSTFDDRRYNQSLQAQLTPSQLKPSHFGALSLILALHVYIWETRRLSHARQWTSSEVEAIHAHIEPALRAWEEAWASHPQSTIERPSPFGTGPMSADSIPLLDLAYIRLFVDLGRSRAPLFARDFQGMVDELNKNWSDNPSGSSSSPSTTSDATSTPQSATSPASSPNSTIDSPNLVPVKAAAADTLSHANLGAISSRHEKHLRRAAFYAADALAMSEKSGGSGGEFYARELPMQALMCAFDCAQVLAEWISAVQERVRPFMGRLGDADCNLMGIDGLMMLENEDRILLGRVIEVLRNAEEKMSLEWSEIVGGPGEVSLSAKVLRVSAHCLEKAAVWPVIRIFAAALRFHAEHIENRPKNLGLALA